MQTHPRKIFLRAIGIIFFIGILVFAYTRFGRYRTGPEVVEISLEDYTSTKELFLPFSGSIRNIEYMHIDGRNIILDKEGTFNEVVVLMPGINEMTIDIGDSFGKRKQYRYTIYSSADKDVYENILEKTSDTEENKLTESNESQQDQL